MQKIKNIEILRILMLFGIFMHHAFLFNLREKNETK